MGSRPPRTSQLRYGELGVSRGLGVDPDVGSEAFGPERLDLRPEDHRVQDDARSDEEPRPGYDAAGGEVELVGPIPHDDCVAGVVLPWNRTTMS